MAPELEATAPSSEWASAAIEAVDAEAIEAIDAYQVPGDRRPTPYRGSVDRKDRPTDPAPPTRRDPGADERALHAEDDIETLVQCALCAGGGMVSADVAAAFEMMCRQREGS